MKWLAPLLAFVCLASHALGCLGDTEEELTKRYGPQTKTGTSPFPGVTIRGYSYNGFLIVVGVLNGRSAFEMYAKKTHAKISPNEVAALMSANSNGRMWTVAESPTPGPTKWVLDDGSAFAEWDKVTAGPLTVKTSEAADLEARSNPKKEAEKPSTPQPSTPKK